MRFRSFVLGSEGPLNAGLDHAGSPEQQGDMPSKRNETNDESHGDPQDDGPTSSPHIWRK
jgi:hypothetical protein